MSSFRCSYKQNLHSGTVDPAGKLEVPSDNGSLEPGQNVCRAQQWIVKVAGISKSRRGALICMVNRAISATGF